jgi:adenylylsulfate kinase-like enzyme
MAGRKRLIIIRGNSASGKTSVATELQKRLGPGTMLLSQDVIRRQILKVSEKQKNPAMKLIQLMAGFGWEHGWETVIVEGILSKKKNGVALKELIKTSDRAYVYYFDIPFEETLRRHATKPNACDYGEKEMRDWWLAADELATAGEVIIDETMSPSKIVALIKNDLA